MCRRGHEEVAAVPARELLRSGTRAVTSQLIDAGHERIGYLSWPIEPGVGADRHRGWLEAMEAAGLETDGLTIECPDGAHEGALHARTLVDAGATAVVCASDSLALGARSAMLADGRGVVVVGFDDTPVARALGMNSVVQPVAGAARTALALLFDAIAGREPRHVLLDPTPAIRTQFSPTFPNPNKWR